MLLMKIHYKGNWWVGPMNSTNPHANTHKGDVEGDGQVSIYKDTVYEN